jgi:hypothetical protein
MKLAYDPDELHDFAMDFLIHQVRRIGDDAEMNEKIFNQLALSHTKVLNKAVSKSKRKKEQCVGEFYSIESTANRRSVEDVLAECTALSLNEQRRLLKAVYWKKGEKLFRSDWERRQWYRETQPKLRKWAIANGLIEGGDDD